MPKGESKIKVGRKWLTWNCGPIEILEKLDKSDWYRVKFIRTGTIRDVRGTQIVDGSVRDPYAPLLCNVACTGNIKTKGKYKIYYSIWHDMINRIYNPKNNRYNANRHVTVCDRWLIFENFYHDRKIIEGFDDDLIRDGKLVLDKDLKQRGFKSKVYSPDTCIWLDRVTNTEMQDRQQRAFIAEDQYGNIYHARNISKFAREHGLTHVGISGVLHGKINKHQGWKFYYEEIV